MCVVFQMANEWPIGTQFFESQPSACPRPCAPEPEPEQEVDLGDADTEPEEEVPL